MLKSCHFCLQAVTITCCFLEQEAVIASNSVEDVVLEYCNARAIRFDCPSMTRLSLRLSNIVSFTVPECSSLRCLDLQGESTSMWLHF